MTDILIRRANHADLPRITSLFSQVDHLHRVALPWLFQQLVEPRPPELLEAMVTGADRATLVATDSSGSSAIAVLVITVRQVVKAPIFRPARVAEIDNLVVDRASRRRGVGRSLVQAALAWAREVEAERTELGVYDFNEQARVFWEAMGFAVVFRRMARQLPPTP